MPRAARLRLRQALEEVIAENMGDHSRAKPRGTDADFIKAAQGLLSQMGDGEGSADSPGRRAAAEESPGRAFDSARERARELLAPVGAQQAGAAEGGR
jgi:hypothetical protein